MKPSLWHWLSQDRGAQIAEFAAVVPMLIMIIFGILWFGRAFNIYTTVNHAAQAAAEAAATPNCLACDHANTFPDQATIKNNIVDPILLASHLDPNNAELTFTLTQHQPLNPSSTIFGPIVNVSYPYHFNLNGVTCCPPALTPISVGVTVNARAQAQEEN